MQSYRLYGHLDTPTYPSSRAHNTAEGYQFQSYHDRGSPVDNDEHTLRNRPYRHKVAYDGVIVFPLLFWITKALTP